jgi:anti-anti-sigma factor
MARLGVRSQTSPGALRGEVDLAVVGEVERELLAAVVAAPGRRVVLDCAALTFIDATGIGMLVRVERKAAKRVQLIHVARPCRRALELAGLDGHFGLARPR